MPATVCSPPISCSKGVKRVTIGIVFSVAALLLAVRNIDLEDLDTLKDLPVPWLHAVAGGLVLMIGVVLRGHRLKLLLPRDDPVPRKVLSGATAILYLVNNLFPARAGEVVRVVLIRRSSNSSLTGLLTATLLERCMDGITIAALVLGAVLALDVSPTMTERATGLGLVFVIAVIVLALGELLYRRNPDLAHRWIARCTPGTTGKRIRRVIEGVFEGLNLMESPARSLGILASSLAIWSSTALGFYLLVLGYPPEMMPHTPFVGAVITGAVAFAASIPAAPGYLGVFQLAVKEALELIGAEEIAALHAALMLWVVNWISNNLLGAFYAIRLGVGWSQLRRETAIDVSPETVSMEDQR